MMALLLATVVFGTGTAFAPSYEAFLVGIWLCGFTTIGYGTVMYCWMMELLTGTAKTVFGCTPHLNFAVWGLLVALIAYLLPDWHHMELVFSIPLFLLVCTYWILPESPRYILALVYVTENAFEA
jgi:OCT family organic cation transporter-like MFS transporter 4/5